MGKRTVEQQPADEPRSHERSRRIARTAGKLGLSALLSMNIVLGSGVAYLQRDIDAGQAELASAHPNVHPIYLTNDPDKAEVATYVATGLGTRNPTETARKLTSHHEVGNVFAVEYSNRDINIEELTDTIVTNARTYGIKYLSFDGYSMGGPIELAVAAEIYEKHDDLHVLSVTMNSSPVGNEGLTAQSKDGGRIMSAVLNYWPELAYSKKARWAAEVLARNHNYFDKDEKSIDWEQLETEINTVYDEKIGNKSAASGSLITSQYNFIYRYGVEKSLVRLSKHVDGKQSPTVYYTRSEDPRTDPVVNTIASGKSFEEAATEHFVPHRVLDIHNIGHANPAERPTEYNKAIFDYVNPTRMSILRVDHGVGGEPEFGDAFAASIPTSKDKVFTPPEPIPADIVDQLPPSVAVDLAPRR